MFELSPLENITAWLALTRRQNPRLRAHGTGAEARKFGGNIDDEQVPPMRHRLELLSHRQVLIYGMPVILFSARGVSQLVDSGE